MTGHMVFKESPFSRFLFNDTHSAVLWLVIRVYVGWAWIQAGFSKVTSEAWTGPDAGSALEGFISGALLKAGGAHPAVQGWYAWFLESVVLSHTQIWSFVIAWGELAVGIALVLGIFTGIAAFFGLFMNFNFLLAGTVSSNPILFVLSIALMLAWKVAGFIGFDRIILPALGTPWQPGRAFGNIVKR